MNAEPNSHAIACAGLPMSQVAQLAHAVRDDLGPDWSVHPWLGRLNARVVVVGHGPQAERAAASASLALMRVITVPDHATEQDFHVASRQIRQALAVTERVPNPYQEASAQSLTTAIARSVLDARARLKGAAWRHPELGLVVVHPRQGWVCSEHRCAEVTGATIGGDWIEQTESPAQRLAHVCSIEHWILQAQLRGRSGAPQYPGDLVLRLAHLPDIAAVTGQPRVLHALLALQDGHSLTAASRQTGCPVRVIDALVSAVALSGLVTEFRLGGTDDEAPRPALTEDPRPLPDSGQLHGLRRIAHYLGISRAIGW